MFDVRVFCTATDTLSLRFEVPQWHKDILDERQQLLEQGCSKMLDWELAKEHRLNRGALRLVLALGPNCGYITSMKAIAEITRECLDLPTSQRLKLARILLDVSDPDQDFSPEVASIWDEEIGARVAAVINGTARSRPIADVFDDLDRRLPA